MPFDHKQLRSFLAVADAGSIGSAAATLNMTQPALSRLIRGLEERHKSPLFERLPTGVVLTAAGETFLPHARLLVFEMEQAADELKALRGLQRGVVRVGGVSAATRTIIAPAIARLRAVSPKLQVQVTEAQDDRLMAALTGYAIDLMVCAHIGNSTDAWQIGDCMFDDTYDVFCAPDHPLMRQEAPLTSRDLISHPWAATPPGSTPRILFEGILRQNELPLPEIAVESRSPEVIVASVVKAGLLGWLPTPLFESELAAGAVVQLPSNEFTLRRHFFLYRRSRGLLSPAAEQFSKALLRNAGADAA